MPRLKLRYNNLDDIPAPLRDYYRPDGDAYVLDADDAVPKDQLEKVRQEMQPQELNAHHQGIDPAEQRAPTEDLCKKQEKQAHIDQLVEDRLERMRPAQEKAVQEVASERDALQGCLNDIQINQAAIAAGTKYGLKPVAIPDLTRRAREAFKWVNGVPVAYEADGKTIKVSADNLTPLGIEEWIATQSHQAPHLFNQSQGQGSLGGLVGGETTVQAARNPFSKKYLNLTQQMRLTRQDPALAAELERRAKAEEGAIPNPQLSTKP